MKVLKFTLLLFFLICLSCQKQMNTDIQTIVKNPVVLPEDPNEVTGVPEEAEPVCIGRYEIGEDEYITMQVVPDIVSSTSINKWIVENHTSKDITYGTPFSMAYFDVNEDKWIRIKFDFFFEDIAYVLDAGATFDRYPGLVASEMNPLYALVKKYNGEKQGKYRISKGFGKYALCAEFEVITQTEPDRIIEKVSGKLSYNKELQKWVFWPHHPEVVNDLPECYVIIDMSDNHFSFEENKKVLLSGSCYKIPMDTLLDWVINKGYAVMGGLENFYIQLTDLFYE